MTIEIFDMPQGDPAWFEIRRGLPTSSMFATVMAKGKDGGPSVTRSKYLRTLATELVTGDPTPEGYINADMQRGHEMEDEARNYFALVRQVQPQRVGFIRNGAKGCSPDSLIGTDAGLEIKSAASHVQIERLQSGKLPSEHLAQVQGSLWVTERDHWNFISYCPKLPPLILTIGRDEAYIANLARAVDAFNEELDSLVTWLRGLK
jgi:hypothetical protein